MSRLDDLRWEREYRRCRGDGTVEGDLKAFEHFCSRYVTIKHPQGRRKLELRDAQRETVRAFLEDERVLVLKARQIGFTTVVMAYCLWAAIFRRDYRIIILNRREEDAKKNLAMAVFAWDQVPAQLKARLPKRTNNHAQRAEFDNGSSIVSYPSNNNPARGDTASLMILDEWAFMPNPDDAWASIEPAADIGGRVIALSTANGIGNLFHKMWVDSENGRNLFRRIFFPWSAVPERDQAWYDAKQRSLPEWQLHQEYPTDPESAFIKSGNAVFPSGVLAQFKRCRRPERGQLVTADGTLGLSDWVPSDEGPLTVYERPQPQTVYVIGADTSEGLEHGDYSSAHVLRAGRHPKVVATWHGLIDPDLFGDELMRIGYWYQTALLGPEANNTGIATIAALKRAHYPWIYRRQVRADARTDRTQEQLGWYTSRSTKPFLINELLAALRDRSVDLEDSPTLAELRSYVRDADGSMHGSPHDDRVMSLAIAVQMLQHAHSPDQLPEAGPRAGSFRDHVNRLQEARKGDKLWVIGRNSGRRSHALV